MSSSCILFWRSGIGAFSYFSQKHDLVDCYIKTEAQLEVLEKILKNCTFSRYWFTAQNKGLVKSQWLPKSQLWLCEIRYDWSLSPGIFSLFAVFILSLKSCFSRLHVKSFDKSNNYHYMENESYVAMFMEMQQILPWLLTLLCLSRIKSQQLFLHSFVEWAAKTERKYHQKSEIDTVHACQVKFLSMYLVINC